MAHSSVVLVVEDDEHINYYYQYILSLNGFTVLTATSLKEAERLIAGTDQIDVVIADGKIIGGETIELVQRIQERYDEIHIVAASNDDELQKRLVDAGAHVARAKHDAPHHVITVCLQCPTE